MARFDLPRQPARQRPHRRRRQRPARRLRRGRVDPGRREISGTASSGLFCGQRPRYRVYFAAVFDRRFDAYGTWKGRRARPRRDAAEDSQEPAANPRTTAAGRRLRQLRHPQEPRRHRPGRHLLRQRRRRPRQPRRRRAGAGASARSAAARRGRWNQALGRVRVSGGPQRLLDTFYTALYHAFLAPRTFSDVGGAYPGMDGAIHRARGRIQYADFSGWDIYRTEVQLLSMLAPRAGERHDPLAARRRRAERLPAALALRQRPEHDHGRRLRRPDHRLRGGLRRRRLRPPGGAGGDGQGRDPALPQRQRRIPRAPGPGRATWRSATSPSTSTPTPATPTRSTATPTRSGARRRPRSSTRSTTSRSPSSPPAPSHDRSTYRAFMRRSANWRRLYNPASGMIEPRYADGAFPDPLRQPRRRRLRRGRLRPVHLDGARRTPPA